jgi:uncharacterized glyoxalase superfamily protein PhnB
VNRVIEIPGRSRQACMDSQTRAWRSLHLLIAIADRIRQSQAGQIAAIRVPASGSEVNMVKKTPYDPQRVIPHLLYRDAGAAVDFLKQAFNFGEREIVRGPEGQVLHAELVCQGNVLMLGGMEGRGKHGNPRELGGVHSITVCYVEDVDGHCTRARDAGAEIVDEPTDQFYGDRTYTARDPEGHEWAFHTHVHEYDPSATPAE